MKRSAETVGSFLLEIAIMLTLLYFGYWEHVFKRPILSNEIERTNLILLNNNHIDAQKISLF